MPIRGAGRSSSVRAPGCRPHCRSDGSSCSRISDRPAGPRRVRPRLFRAAPASRAASRTPPASTPHRPSPAPAPFPFRECRSGPTRTAPDRGRHARRGRSSDPRRARLPPTRRGNKCSEPETAPRPAAHRLRTKTDSFPGSASGTPAASARARQCQAPQCSNKLNTAYAYGSSVPL